MPIVDRSKRLVHDPTMSEANHSLIVGRLSPFSDKVQAIFRYKGIPFTRIEVNPKLIAEVLVPNGLVLGLMIDNGERFSALLEEVTLPLHPGDVFVFFTDGISEQMNTAEEMFGEGRLGALVEEHAEQAPEELRERIVREVRAFAGEAAQHDDMTFILVRVNHVEQMAAGAGARAEEVLV